MNKKNFIVILFFALFISSTAFSMKRFPRAEAEEVPQAEAEEVMSLDEAEDKVRALEEAANDFSIRAGGTLFAFPDNFLSADIPKLFGRSEGEAKVGGKFRALQKNLSAFAKYVDMYMNILSAYNRIRYEFQYGEHKDDLQKAQDEDLFKKYLFDHEGYKKFIMSLCQEIARTTSLRYFDGSQDKPQSFAIEKFVNKLGLLLLDLIDGTPGLHKKFVEKLLIYHNYYLVVLRFLSIKDFLQERGICGESEPEGEPVGVLERGPKKRSQKKGRGRPEEVVSPVDQAHWDVRKVKQAYDDLAGESLKTKEVPGVGTFVGTAADFGKVPKNIKNFLYEFPPNFLQNLLPKRLGLEFEALEQVFARFAEHVDEYLRVLTDYNKIRLDYLRKYGDNPKALSFNNFLFGAHVSIGSSFREQLPHGDLYKKIINPLRDLLKHRILHSDMASCDHPHSETMHPDGRIEYVCSQPHKHKSWYEYPCENSMKELCKELISALKEKGVNEGILKLYDVYFNLVSGILDLVKGFFSKERLLSVAGGPSRPCDGQGADR